MPKWGLFLAEAKHSLVYLERLVSRNFNVNMCNGNFFSVNMLLEKNKNKQKEAGVGL